MPRRDDAPRDLLFGLLALQNGLIDQVQLVAAFQAWTRDKSKPLADHLVNRGDLDVEQRGVIDAMVALHLRKHGSTERSLAAVGVGASTRERLASLADPDIDASLPPPTRNVDADHTLTLDVGTATSEGQRFRVLRPHARGGLGAVFVALDHELHREVALKQILDDRADDAASRQRFLLEAEITGGLEHPGIVPVYGLGTHANGRPYYAMRFIKGDSLKDAITRFHDSTLGRSGVAGVPSAGPRSDDGGRNRGSADGTPATQPTTTTRELELRKLLRRFLDVCNAIHYAHARGVLHRDIKPGNIIVGKYGETLVVDWGLAKSRGMVEPSSDERPLITSSSGGAPTQAGSAIGTPQYMSPEQARGELDRLDARSDVHSLGATLYHLLTGRPPFSGTIEEVLRGVERGEFARPRQLDPTIDPALEAICLKAMALRQDDRYASAKALADDIERWTADEPVTAYPEPFTRRARRWMRRHRTLVTTAAATVLVGLAGLGAVAAVLATKNGQLDAKNNELGRLNVELAQRNEDLDEQRNRAENREKQAIDAVKRFRDVLVEEPALQTTPALKDLRNRLLKEPLAFFRSLRDQLQVDRDSRPESLARLARAAFELGELARDIGDKQDALRAFEDSRAIREQLARENLTATEFQSNLAADHGNIGNLQRETGQPEAAMRSYEQAQAILERLARENPAVTRFQSDLALLRSNLGLLQSETGQPEAALRSYEQARVIRERLARENPAVTKFQSDLARSHHNIGLFQSETGQPEAALLSHEHARAIQERLARENPAVAQFQSDLAFSHNSIGALQSDTSRPEAALRSYAQARAIWDRLARENPAVTAFQSDLASSHNNIGALQSATGQPEAALRSYEQARAILERLARENPAGIEFQRGLARSQYNIGNLQRTTGQPDAALRSYEQARAIRERLARENPAVTAFQSDLASSHNNIGVLLHATGQPEAALRSFEQARSIRDQLARENPAVTAFQNDLASSHNNIGSLQSETGQPEAALRSYERARAIFERLARENPAVTEFQSGLASSHNNIGILLRSMGQSDSALESSEQARAIRERLAREHPESPDYASDLGGTLNGLASHAINAQRFGEARDRLNQAIAWQRKALAVKPRHPQYRQHLKNHLTNLILAARALGRDEEVAKAQRELDELSATDPRFAALDARLAAVAKGEAVKDDPERLALAQRAYDLGRYALGARLWAETLESDPKLGDDRQAQHRYNAACAAALAAAGKSRGKDDPPPDDAAKAKLRGQALGWLKAELDAWSSIAASGSPQTKAFITQTLQHWREDTDLAAIRDPGALATLPDAERQAWRNLWEEVGALLRKAAGASQSSDELPRNPFAP